MKASDFPMADIEAATPDLPPAVEYMDADEEMVPLAERIKSQTPHNSELKVDRIKFLYTTKPKKEGGKFTIGELIVRNEKERAVYDAYDFVVIVYHPTWKELDKVNKFIQLDRLLCGVNIDTKESGVETVKKSPFDSREYMDNMHYWGADAVLRSSETVHLAASRYAEEIKEEKAQTKKAKANATKN